MKGQSDEMKNKNQQVIDDGVGGFDGFRPTDVCFDHRHSRYRERY